MYNQTIYKRVIYSSTLQGDVYITLMKIMGAIYHIYSRDIQKEYFRESAQRNHEICADFMGISNKLNTEYNFDKHTEFGNTEQLVALCDSFDLEAMIHSLFNTLLGNLPNTVHLEIEFIEDVPITIEQRQHIKRLFNKYIKFTYKNI